MVIGICVVNLHIPGSQSLKNKRQAVKSIKDKIRANFNVSVSEVGGLDTWQRSTLGISCINNNKSYIERIFHRIISLVQTHRLITLLDYTIDMI
ncbi:MAG: DUF503 domain-containing protein [bacterium]